MALPELPESLFHRTPHRLVDISVKEIFDKGDAPEEMRVFGRQLLEKGWRFYAVEQACGRTYFKQLKITIPLWVLNKGDKSKIRWYIAHEMAHAFDYIIHGKADHHGPLFMEQLKRICPVDDQHWEHGYKPRNAAAAGVSLKGSL